MYNSGYYLNGDPANQPDKLTSLMTKIDIGVGVLALPSRRWRSPC